MIALERYIDGWLDAIGKETTVIPRMRFPFKVAQTPETYSRIYERDYEIIPRSPPRIDQRTAWTNLLTYSEDTDNAAWTKTNLTVSANNTTAPDGLVTMDKLLETTTNGQHSIAQAATVTAAAHEVSIFAKAGLTREWIKLEFTDSAAATFSAFFNVARGYFISASANTTATITNLGNGHYYCAIRFTPAAGAGSCKVNVSTDGSTTSYAGTTTAGLYLWGAQVALGSLAPYISTTAAARSTLAPDRDPRDPLAFLLMESDPEPISSQRQRITRTFGRIPRIQYVTGSRYIPKPKISGTFPRVFAGVLVDHPDPDVDEYTFTSQIAVTYDSGVPGQLPSGGTYTLSFNGNTTAALAYNADAATVQAALNGLASVIAYGSVSVSGSHTAGFTVAWVAYAGSTVDASSLTATNASIVVAGIPAGISQRVIITPNWTTAGGVVTSSVTPADANPLDYFTGAGKEILYFYKYKWMGVGSPVYASGGTYTITAYGQTTAAIAWDANNATIIAALNLLSEATDRGGAYAVPANVVGVSVGVVNDPALSGGTFTLTVLGQTTGAIAYNASTATIATAINALSNVTARGGVTVSGAGFASGKQDFTINFANIPALTGSGASLTPSGTSLHVAATTVQGLANTISFTVSSSSTRLLTAASHLLGEADTLTVTIAGTTYTVDPGEFTVPDANSILLKASSGIVGVSGTATAVGGDTGKRYAADSPQIACEFTTAYYLPGVSPGIDEVADIPIPSRGTPAQLLGAIFGGSTLFNYEVGEFGQFEETPVVSITLTTINPQLLVSPDG